MGIYFTQDAWEDYLYWQGQDKKTLKRINKIIKAVFYFLHWLIKQNIKCLELMATNNKLTGISYTICEFSV